MKAMYFALVTIVIGLLLTACGGPAANNTNANANANKAAANTNTAAPVDPATAKAEVKKVMDATQAALNKNDADAMDKIRGAVSACYGQFHQPGRADLTFVVAPSGQPQSVTVGGVFNGTPTGDCAANAFKTAKFPSFDGPAQEFVYPFFLR